MTIRNKMVAGNLKPSEEIGLTSPYKTFTVFT